MDGRDYLEVIESLQRQNRDEMRPSSLADGDDTPSLLSTVADAPPSHWGSLTSTARTMSEAYLKFLGRR